MSRRATNQKAQHGQNDGVSNPRVSDASSTGATDSSLSSGMAPPAFPMDLPATGLENTDPMLDMGESNWQMQSPSYLDAQEGCIIFDGKRNEIDQSEDQFNAQANSFAEATGDWYPPPQTLADADQVLQNPALLSQYPHGNMGMAPHNSWTNQFRGPTMATGSPELIGVLNGPGRGLSTLNSMPTGFSFESELNNLDDLHDFNNENSEFNNLVEATPQAGSQNRVQNGGWQNRQVQAHQYQNMASQLPPNFEYLQPYQQMLENPQAMTNVHNAPATRAPRRRRPAPALAPQSQFKPMLGANGLPLDWPEEMTNFDAFVDLDGEAEANSTWTRLPKSQPATTQASMQLPATSQREMAQPASEQPAIAAPAAPQNATEQPAISPPDNANPGDSPPLSPFEQEIRRGGYVNYFRSFEEAYASRYDGEKDVPRVIDRTIPRNWRDKSRAVRRLFFAIKNITNTHDFTPEDAEAGKTPPVAWKHFEGKKYPDKKVQAVCWELLHYSLQKYEEGKGLPNWQRSKKGKTHNNFADYMDELCDVLRRTKTVCKRLFDPVVFEDIVDNPMSQMKRAIQNKRLNKHKAEQISIGRAHFKGEVIPTLGDGGAEGESYSEAQSAGEASPESTAQDYQANVNPNIRSVQRVPALVPGKSSAPRSRQRRGRPSGTPNVKKNDATSQASSEERLAMTLRQSVAGPSQSTASNTQQPGSTPTSGMAARQQTPANAMKMRRTMLGSIPGSQQDPRQVVNFTASSNAAGSSRQEVPPQPMTDEECIEDDGFYGHDDPKEHDKIFFDRVYARENEDVEIGFNHKDYVIKNASIVNKKKRGNIFMRNWLHWPLFKHMRQWIPTTRYGKLLGASKASLPLGPGDELFDDSFSPDTLAFRSAIGMTDERVNLLESMPTKVFFPPADPIEPAPRKRGLEDTSQEVETPSKKPRNT
ncbi:MAG: hypothetical protein M1825_003200 [Sarcosagium campestre]|nr:MAG: hypothetical protein M1825_003200 [Sarcosagium campestre]